MRRHSFPWPHSRMRMAGRKNCPADVGLQVAVRPCSSDALDPASQASMPRTYGNADWIGPRVRSA